MKIISPGMREGLVYQRTTVWTASHTLAMRKEAYRLLKDIEHCPINEWVESQDWNWVTDPEQKARAIQSEINWREHMPEELESYRCHYSWIVAYQDPDEEPHEWRYGKIYPYIKEENLEVAIDKAAAVFSQDAVIRSIEKTRFGQEASDRLREYPVPDGVLQYIRNEFPKRRQKLILEID